MKNRRTTDHANDIWFWARTVCFRGLRGVLIWSVIGCVIGFEVSLALGSSGPSVIAQMIIQGGLFGIIGFVMGVVFDNPIATVVGASTGLFVGLIGTKLLPEFSPYKTQLVCLLMGTIFGASFMSYLGVIKRGVKLMYNLWRRLTGKRLPPAAVESEAAASPVSTTQPSALVNRESRGETKAKLEKSTSSLKDIS